jgi:hypothetical protein
MFSRRERVSRLARSAPVSKRSTNQLEQRISAEGVGVVLVLVAAGYLKDVLLDERYERVAHLSSAPLRHLLRYLFAQAKFGIYSGDLGEPTVEGDLKREVRFRLKAGRWCGTISHREPPVRYGETVSLRATRPYPVRLPYFNASGE